VLTTLICSMIHVVDRPYSFSIVMPKKTGIVDGSMYMAGDLSMEPVDNTTIFDAMVEVIKKSERDKVSLRYSSWDDIDTLHVPGRSSILLGKT
jgi:hypothetical protein